MNTVHQIGRSQLAEVCTALDILELHLGFDGGRAVAFKRDENGHIIVVDDEFVRRDILIEVTT